MIKLILLGTVGCHLCEEAELIMASCQQVDIELIDIAEQEQWQEKYAIRIPVLYHLATESELGWPFDQRQAQGFIDSLGRLMQPFKQKLKKPARYLRSNLTDAEQALWYRVRRKQIRSVQFLRQKPLLNFIVDFYCSKAQLVVELDDGQHFEPEYLQKDIDRDKALKELGVLVLRFDNRQVLTEMDAVLAEIDRVVEERLKSI